MNENDRKPELDILMPHSPLEVLQQTIKSIAQFEVESKISIDVDPGAYTQALANEADTIIALPGKLEKLRESGIFVSENITSFADAIAFQAEKMRATDNLFGLSVLLIPQGSRQGDPNLLEDFTSKLGDEASGKHFSELVNPGTKRDRCVEIIKGLLTPDEVIGIKYTRDEAADTIVESLSYLGVFAPAPATFDKPAFEMTGGADLHKEVFDTVWDFLIRTGILNDESSLAEGRVSISDNLTQMLLNPSNGFLTYEE